MFSTLSFKRILGKLCLHCCEELFVFTNAISSEFSGYWNSKISLLEGLNLFNACVVSNMQTCTAIRVLLRSIGHYCQSMRKRHSGMRYTSVPTIFL